MISRLSSSGNSPPWYLPEIKRSASLILWARCYAKTASKFTLVAIALQAAAPFFRGRRVTTGRTPTTRGWRASLRFAPRTPERARFSLLRVFDMLSRHPEIAAELRTALVHSVLRFSHMVRVGDYFLTRPPPPPEEYY